MTFQIISQHVGFDLIKLDNGKIARVNHNADGVFTSATIANTGPGSIRVTEGRFTKLYKELTDHYTAENFCK
jgi:hypothetical protein